jgi:hypothetical protein
MLIHVKHFGCGKIYICTEMKVGILNNVKYKSTGGNVINTNHKSNTKSICPFEDHQ